MDVLLLIVFVVLVALAAAEVAWLAASRRFGSPAHAQEATSASAELQQLSALVHRLGDATAVRFGQVDQSLRMHGQVTQSLAHTAQGLHEALASSTTRGQWGERMADDVLRAAGLHEGINYVKRTAVAGEGHGIPDFTFLLPRGHVLFMDVKFPMAAYQRYLDATTDHERLTHRATFVRDVRCRVRELARREYARVDDRPAIDNVLLFVPNESLASFIHESDGSLLDDAMRENVVVCSPLTLFTFLGVIRQAFDNFMVEQASDEILVVLGRFEQQWDRYGESIDKVKRQLDTVARSFDELAGPRRRQLQRQVSSIGDIRRSRGLPEVDHGSGADDDESIDQLRGESWRGAPDDLVGFESVRGLGR